jgi:hypothetical protein
VKADFPGPLPAASPPQEDGLSWLGIGALVVGAIVVVAAWLHLRARRTGRDDFERLPSPAEVVVRPASDGFWIDSPGLPVGTTLRYRCRLGGRPHEDRFTVAAGPSGLFVYTGSTPADIVILEIQPPQPAKPVVDWDMDPLRATAPRPPRPTSPRPPRPTTRPTPPQPAPWSPDRSSFPSAY